MTKPIPSPTFRNIRPPNSNYTYFENIQNFPFRPLATDFELVNAGWLADLALLAYADEQFIQRKLDNAGLTAQGFVMKFLSSYITQCFVIHNDHFIVVSMRGTEIDNFWGAFDDWLRNLEFAPVRDESGGSVHEGFRKDIDEIWNNNNLGPSLKSYLQQVLGSGPRALWITGHSLGAALATLAAERAVRDAGFAVQGVYTYGSPRVGDTEFKQHYEALGLNAKTFRILHGIDIAQKLFPGATYTHVGQLKYIDSGGILHPIFAEQDLPEPSAVQASALGLFRLLGNTAASIADALGLPIPAPIADHAPIYYASYIWNNQ